MLIAVASKDGKEINQHFGHADRFFIYDVDGEKVTLMKEKVVERYCSDDPDHQLRKHILSALADSVKGCRAVVCAQIGQAPQMEMERLRSKCLQPMDRLARHWLNWRRYCRGNRW
jgi:predicted Fe-Mo cluster-binding NifX family protein